MKEKLAQWYQFGGKIPRKTKKKILGKKLSGSMLNRMLQETSIGQPIKTMFEIRVFSPHGAFCPKCGESGYVGMGNRASYPDHWEAFRCVRCRNIVGYIDNSPFIHALECKESNYDPTF